MAPRNGEEGRFAYACRSVGRGAPRPDGRTGLSKVIDSGTGARPGNPGRLPGIGDETTLSTGCCRSKPVLGFVISSCAETIRQSVRDVASDTFRNPRTRSSAAANL